MLQDGGFMCYRKLWAQYLRDAEIVKTHIKSLKKSQKDIPEEKSKSIKYRIDILYNIYLDLIHTAKYLEKKCEVMKRGK